jgi:OTU domain-containing protein 3
MGRKKKNKKSKQQHTSHHAADREWKKSATRRSRKRGKQAQYNQQFLLFSAQLSKLRLYIRDMGSDGNCLFRAMADQLYSSEHECDEVRATLCDFVEANRLDFEPFIEDDEPFDDYIERMREDGEWGGNFELAAAVQCFGINIVVHNFQAPRYQLTCHDTTKAVKVVGGGTIHVSYHDGEHYNSVRVLGDTNRVGRALMSETVKVLADPTASMSTMTEADKLQAISRSTGCSDMSYVKQMLVECDGDQDAAIECLIAELAAGADWTVNDMWKNNELYGETKSSAVTDGVDGDLEWSKVKNKKKKKMTKREKKAEKRRQRQLQRNGGGGDHDDNDDDDEAALDEFGALVI